MRQRAKFAAFMVSAAVFAGAWLVAESMLREPEAAQEAMTEQAAERIPLAVGSRGELTALSWAWEGETVNLRRDDVTGLWVDTDDPACPIDAGAAEALARAAASVTASLAVEDVTDMAQYGLDPAGLTVLAAAGERTASYEVGNMSITGEYYTRVDGGDTVYLADGSLAAFRTALDALLALETLPEDVASVDGLAVRSDAESYTLARRAEGEAEPGWYRTDGASPVRLIDEQAQALCGMLLSTDLTDCVTWRPEDAAACGVDDPQLIATLSYRNGEGRAGSFSLVFGAYEGEEIYVSLAGSDMIYLTNAEVADALMYPAWDRLTPASVMTLDPDDIASFTVTVGGETCEVLRLEEPGGETEDGETAPAEVLYSLNGWVLDKERVEEWLLSLAALPAEENSPPGGGRQTLLCLTVTWKDAEAVPAELELKSYDSAHGLCVLGGDRAILVPRTDAEAVLDAAQKLFLAGQLKNEEE